MLLQCTQSFWGGRYNEVAGTLRRLNPDGTLDLKSKKNLIAILSGNWATVMYIQRVDLPGV